MSDDHAANAISSYGSRLAEAFQTPNIDRIANEGIILNNCHCTNSICTPSRATIMTGQHSHTNGVYTLRDRLDTNRNTFAKMMQEDGYQTAVFGKWHLHSEPQGFDYWNVLPGQGLYFDPYLKEKGMEYEGDYDRFKGKQYRGYVTDLITDMALDWLKKLDEDKPFMMMVHHKAPHDNFEYHPRHEHIFDGVQIPEPASLWEDKRLRSPVTEHYGTSVSERNPRRNVVKTMSQPDYVTGQLDIAGLDAKGRTKAAYQKYLKDYLRCVACIDDNVGRLLDYLDDEGLAENTVVIYTSDQGMFLGEHDYIDKRWIYEESLQMPFLMRYPGEIIPGSKCEDIITNVDFAPTFLDYADIEPAADMQGCSFRDNVKGQTPEDWPKALYYRYWMHMAHHDNPAHYGIRTQEYKLIFFYGLPLDASGALPDPTPAGWELYDLRKDPEELRSVYSDPEYKDVIEDLKGQLLEMKKELGDEDERYPEMMALRERLRA
jgi:arylsulfatase A-like enzyme